MVICQLPEAGWRSYAWVSELCHDQLFDAGLRLFAQVRELCQLFETCCWLSAWICELSQIFEAGWRLFVSYMRRDNGYLSVIWARLALIS